MTRLARAAAIVTLAGLAVVPAAADDFDRAVALLPGDIDSLDTEFVFAAPPGGFLDPEAGRLASIPFDPGLTRGLSDPGPALAAAGVDLSRLRAGLVLGSPPNVATMLIGDGGFLADPATALAASGYEAGKRDGLPTLWRGDDLAVDLSRAGEPDPFAGGMGRAARIGLLGNAVLFAAGWGPFDAAAGGFVAGPNPYGGPDEARPWHALAAAIRAAAGSGATVEAAYGLPARLFLEGPDPALLLDGGPGADLDALADEMRAQAMQGMPPFAAVLLAATGGPDGPAAHIALIYADERIANPGIAIVAERLGEALSASRELSLPGEPLAIDTSLRPFAYGTVAVASVRYAGDAPLLALEAYRLWISAAMIRDFWPLTVFGTRTAGD